MISLIMFTVNNGGGLTDVKYNELYIIYLYIIVNGRIGF